MSDPDKHSRQLAKLLNLPVAALLVLLTLLPVLFEVGPRLESNYFPVVKHLVDTNDTPRDDSDDIILPIVAEEFPSPEGSEPYVDVFVQFDKVRDCSFLIKELVLNGELVRLNRSLSWYDDTGQRLRLDFSPEDIDLPHSRPVGNQVAGPWRLHGVRTTQGTTALVAHRCHPLWLTYSQFHP